MATTGIRLARTCIVTVALLIALGAGASSASAVPYTVKTLHFSVKTGPDQNVPCDIVGDLYRPASATAKNPAPAILTTNGFGGSKDDQANTGKLQASRGYVVLSYSGLGFGGSGCKITLDDRDYDGIAASQLVTFLGGGKAAKDGTRVDYVQHDRVAHDGKRHDFDPRVGMIGGSYGGQIQFATAGVDPRVDTIIPIITWNDLSYSLAPNNTSFDHGVTYQTPGIEKYEWTSLFFGLGIADGITGTSADPSRNVGCPNFDNRACGSKVQMDATGAPNDATLLFSRHASVTSFLDKIRIPTLLSQGQSDTLFNLQEAIATYRGLRARRVPVKMIWRLGGHSGGGAPGEIDDTENGEFKDPAHNYETRTYSQWFDHYLAGDALKPKLDVSYFRDWIKYKGDATQAYARAAKYPFGSKRTLYLSGTDSLVPDLSKVAAGSAGFTASTGPATSYTETSALDQSQPVRDGPGSFAQFAGAPLTSDLDVVGVPTADVRIVAPAHEAAASAGGAPALLVLFFKLYELKPDGEIVLAHRLIAPVRIADFTHPVHVELPGIVHRFTKGSRIALTIAASDAAYRGNNVSGPVTIVTSPSAPGVLKLPVTPVAKQRKVPRHPLAPPIPNRFDRGNVIANNSGPCAVRKRFVLKVHHRNKVRITSVDFLVNGKRVKRVTGKALKRPVDLTKKVPRGKFKLGVVIRGLKHGRRITIRDTRSYSACKHRQKGKNHHDTTTGRTATR
jgi:predicted acyl esterase